MADLAPAGSAQELDLADAEGWKVIVEHELLVVLADQRVDFLFVRCRSQSRHNQRLGFASSEQS